jgi:hypothetical protein
MLDITATLSESLTAIPGTLVLVSFLLLEIGCCFIGVPLSFLLGCSVSSILDGVV